MIEVENYYANGPLYNLISDERGSFYKDVHGLVHLIAELPLDHGVLELGSGWDERGAQLIQHELRGMDVTYARDAGNYVDLTQRGALAPAFKGAKFSCVTGLCYLLNAIVRENPPAPATYKDLVTVLTNVRSVLVDDGAAVFGIYEPGLDVDKLQVDFREVVQPNYPTLRRLDPKFNKGSELKYTVNQTTEDKTLTCWFTDIWVGDKKFNQQYKFKTPFWSNLWDDVDIHNAALAAGFSDIQFFQVHVTVQNGYSEFNLVACTADPKHASHVLLLA